MLGIMPNPLQTLIMKNLDRRMSSVMALIVVLLVLNVWFAYHNIRQMNDDERLVWTNCGNESMK
jgi:hypothetical protein